VNTRPLLIPLLVCAAIALTATPALAHAVLVASSPEANAALDQAPAYVQLTFSEAVEPTLSGAQVFNAGGARVDSGDARVDAGDPTRLTLTLRPISDGVYTVSWKVASAVDAHVTEGAFPFAVGQGAPAAVPTESTTPAARPSTGEILSRWLTYLAAAVLIGGNVFVLAVWRPAFAEGRAYQEPLEEDPAGAASFRRTAGQGAPANIDGAWSRLAGLGLIGMFTGMLLGLWSQAALVGGGLATASDPALGRVLLSTRYGALWSARVALALAIGAMTYRRNSGRLRLLALLPAAGLLLTLSLGSHSATDARPALPVLNDFAHLAAASIWVGGLTHFVAGMAAVRRLPAPARTHLTAALIPRFSRVALLSVAWLALSGLIAGVLRVGAWSDLIATGYGGALLAKVILAAVMIGFGAVNLLVVTPAMRRGGRQPGGAPGLVAFFSTMIRGEVALGILAFAAAGILTSLPPTRTPSAPAALTLSGRAEDLKVVLEVSPGRVGWNTFLVSLTSEGEPATAVNAVDLDFTPTNAGVSTSRARLAPVGDGRYRAEGAYLSLVDRWTMRVAVRRDRMFDAIVNLTLDLNPAEQGFAWPRLTGAFLMLAAVPAWGLLQARRGRLWSTALRALPSLAFLALGGAALARPLPQRLPANPVAPTAASIESGRSLYQEHCVPCHGSGGRGDGPIGLTLNPRPVDLTVHTIPGVHPDGQLYDWITNGFPGSVMPAWRDGLPDVLRWDLVNYLRTLAPGAVTPVAAEPTNPLATPLAPVPTLSPSTPIPATDLPQPSPAPIYVFEAPFPWSNLSVSGRLLFLTYDTEVVPNLLPVPFIAQLDLGSGVVTAVWRPPQDTWLSGMELSPDGTKLAIAYTPPPPPGPRFSGYPGLYILPGECLNLQCPEAEPEPLVEGTETDSYFGPVWALDGSSLYFTHVDSPLDGGVPTYSIERVAAGRGAAELVLSHATWPRPSPDGTSLAYVAFDLLEYKNDLYYASPDGSKSRPAMPAGIFLSVDAPLFSPDGEFIYFSAAGLGPETSGAELGKDDRTWLDRLMGVQVAHANGMPSEWWRLPLSGGDPERLTVIGASGLSGAFSPDGGYLGFVSYGGMGMLGLEEGRLTWIFPATTFGNLIWLP